jgi:hypothetical protein
VDTRTTGSDVGQPRRRFGPPYWLSFVIVSLTYQLPLAFLVAAVALGTQSTQVLTLYPFFAGAVGLGSLVSAYRTACQTGPVVGPQGIACEGTWGGPLVVPWDEVTGTDLTYVFGLSDLLVSARGAKRPVWVPLQVADPEGFAAAVREFAGDDHPITREVSEWLYRE